MSDFEGIPEAGLHFLKELAENNNRPWFEAHKKAYQSQVEEPAVALVIALGERLKTLSPNLIYDTRTNGTGSLMRIHCDIRFSKDKTPYRNTRQRNNASYWACHSS